MRGQNMKQKRKLATLAATTGLIGIIGVGSTLAYFTDSDAATNIIETGKVDISLFETKDNGDGTLTATATAAFQYQRSAIRLPPPAPAGA